MNTETKAEWRTVPVEPTEEILNAMAENDDSAEPNLRLMRNLYLAAVDAATNAMIEVSLERSKASTIGLYFRRTPHEPWKKCKESYEWNAHNYYAAPTPQASEPVAEVSEVAVYPDTNGKYQSIVLSDVGLPVGTKLFAKPQHAKPCERCAELDLLLRDLLCVIHRDGGQHIRAHGIEQSVEDAKEKFFDLRDLPEKLAALEAENTTIAQQAERIKELEGAIERMRTAGGKNEFQKAFDAAKGLLRNGASVSNYELTNDEGEE